jgi:putative colanic acid biosynthesis acetyltransferase WcaF
LVVQLWWFVQATFFRGSPQLLYGFRRWLLRQFGAQIGKGVIIRPSVTIPYPWKLQIGDNSWIGDHAVLYSFAEITIGKNVVVSQKSYLCAGTHDYRIPSFDIQAFPIVIHDEAWLAADVFVAPGVTIGRGTVVGSRSSVFSDLPEMMVCVGSPARPVHARV